MVPDLHFWNSYAIQAHDMRLKWHQLHPWTISGGSRMEVVHSSLFCLTSWQLSIPLTLVSFWADLGRWHGFVLVYLFSLKPVLISVDKTASSPCFVRGQRARCPVCFLLTFTWNHLVRSPITTGWDITNRLMIPNYISPSWVKWVMLWIFFHGVWRL